jgi:DNA-directed RNA polymerase subunit RPC12/RpoP
MFYGEEEIASNLVCPRCKVKFVDPRIIVPCLETLCINCIEELTDVKTNEINCHFCRVKHLIPAAGFGPNKLMAQLLSLKANEVSRSANVEAVKEKLSRIEQLKDQLKTNIETSELIINEQWSR